MSGQTLNDRLTAARHTLAGQGLARIVCKATTEEAIGPKKKHLDYLLHCTNEPNVSIPQLANLLIERTQHSSWVVVFKALVTVHHLMCYGNERFTQYLASSNCTFQLSNFIDKTGVQGYDMSTFIRRYAKYLNEKAVSYRSVAFDFCKVKRGKDDGTLRTMNTERLLKTVPVLQNQLDALLEFDCTANDLSNGVINSCFMLLFRDLIRLFACYNDGIINLLEKYFDMNKKNCREALDIYKKFLIRMDRVAEFLKVAENVGIDKGDIPDLTKAPSSLLDALEQHLATLEGKKGTTTTPAATRATNLKNAMFALSSTSNAFGTAGGTGSTNDVNGVKVDDNLRRALEEEAAIMNQHKYDDSSPTDWKQPNWDDLIQAQERRLKEIGQPGSPTLGGEVIKTNPFLPSPEAPPHLAPPSAAAGDGIIDLFSSPTATDSGAATTNKASDDLLCLSGNPFANSLFGSASPPGMTQAQPMQQPPQVQAPFPAFSTNGFASGPPPGAPGFASDTSFAAAFGTSASSAAPGITTDAATVNMSGFDAFGDMLQPQQTTSSKMVTDGKPGVGPAGGLLKGDLDTSLANLAQNLDINGPKQSLKKLGGHQWGSPKPQTKTGGANWTPQMTAAAGAGMAWGSPQHGFQPAQSAPPGQWGAGGMMAGPFPQQPPAVGMIPQQSYPVAGMRPMAPSGMGMGMSMSVGMNATPPIQQQQMGMYPGMQPPRPGAPPTNAGMAQPVNDPFGAL